MNRESSAWDVNVTIEILTGMDDGALEGLENAYLTEIGDLIRSASPEKVRTLPLCTKMRQLARPCTR